jgi:hypothetical protein
VGQSSAQQKNQSAPFCQRYGESQARDASAPTKKLKSRHLPAFSFCDIPGIARFRMLATPRA